MDIFTYIVAIIIFIVLYFAYMGNKLTNVYLRHLYECLDMIISSPYLTLDSFAKTGDFPTVKKIVQNFAIRNTFDLDNLSGQDLQSLYIEISHIMVGYIGVNSYPNNENAIIRTSEDLKKNIKFREEFKRSMDVILGYLGDH